VAPPCNLCRRPTCPLCKLWDTRPDYRAHWERPARPPVAAPRPSPPIRLPCRWEGPVVAWCPRGDESLHERRCDHPDGPDLCRRAHECRGCGLYAVPPPPLVPEAPELPPGVTWPIRFDEHNLAVGQPGKRFNTSIAAVEGGYLLAYRDGWRGSEIHTVRLDPQFRPVGDPARLNLRHADADYGREDARLFYHRGRLHLSFIGVVGGRRIKHTNQLFARLTADGRGVEDVFSPADYPPGRRRSTARQWQKNWQFFDHAGQLYAVYTIAPHRVLRIDSNDATLVHETPTPLTWPGGEMRGGAAPVLVGDEWWCWFHDRIEDAGHRVYRVGLYTFAADPPFRVRRYAPEPIMVADRATKPPDQYASVVFPSGAVKAGGAWVVSMGVHDRWTELHAFAHADLDSRLVRVAPPPWWAMRDGTGDPGIVASVAGLNEYRLPDRIDGPVVDVGAHVGAFALAAWERGCRSAHCYEPDPRNRELLARNAAAMPGVVVHPEAVGGTAGTLYYRRAPADADTGNGVCAGEPPGQPIAAVTLDEAIRRAGGRVAVLKLDCESCEYAALASCTTLALVDRVALEYHAGGDVESLRALLEASGFVVAVEPGPDEPGRGLLFADRIAP
jgi:FkbM family methyltransferase